MLRWAFIDLHIHSEYLVAAFAVAVVALGTEHVVIYRCPRQWVLSKERGVGSPRLHSSQKDIPVMNKKLDRLKMRKITSYMLALHRPYPEVVISKNDSGTSRITHWAIFRNIGFFPNLSQLLSFYSIFLKICTLQVFQLGRIETSSQAPSYASPKLWPARSLTGVKCRATSVAKNVDDIAKNE